MGERFVPKDERISGMQDVRLGVEVQKDVFGEELVTMKPVDPLPEPVELKNRFVTPEETRRTNAAIWRERKIIESFRQK